MQTYPPIPTGATLFQRGYGYEPVAAIRNWEWSTTFGRWTAYVTFADGFTVWTFAKPYDC